MITGNSVLVAAPEEQRAHVPTWGKPRDIYASETYYVSLFSAGEDDSCGLGSHEHGQCVELCFAAEMPEVVLSQQRRRILDFDRVTTMRVYATAADKRTVVVKEDDLLTKPDVHVNPVKVSKALYTELKTWFGTEFFKVQDISKKSNIMISMCANIWTLVKDENGEMERTNGMRPVLWGFMDLEVFDVEAFSGAERRSS
eukprot:1973056-Pyramimonas_sp.AAC.2